MFYKSALQESQEIKVLVFTADLDLVLKSNDANVPAVPLNCYLYPRKHYSVS